MAVEKSFLLFDHVSFAYPEAVKRVFTDLSAHFAPGWTAVTGPNGGGKSTLLKLACRVLAPESGLISGVERERCLYCEQESVLSENWQDFFWSADSEIRRIFSLLQIGDDFPERWETLSGGEKKRLQVACALCEKPLLLALDEPTNHLDAASTRIIAAGLKAHEGLGLLVSHNRDLMDELCPKTFYISEFEQTMYEGGVSEVLRQRAETEKSRRTAWQTAQNDLKRTGRQVQRWTEETAKTANRMSKSRLDPKDSDGRGKINLARLTGKDASAANVKARLQSTLAHKEAQTERLAKPLARKRGVTLAAERLERDVLCFLPAQTIRAGSVLAPDESRCETYALSIPELTILPSSRIALTGENGSGKTLLIRRILAALDYDESDSAPVTQNGLVCIPQEISPAQENVCLAAFDDLNDAEKGAVLSQIYRLGSDPLAFLPPAGSVSDAGKRAAAAKNSGFSQRARVSPGELRKLVIAYALQTRVSFLILDEPTNHLDLDAVLLLEEALKEADCALLLCSHDAAFIRSLTSETWQTRRDGESHGILEKIHS